MISPQYLNESIAQRDSKAVSKLLARGFNVNHQDAAFGLAPLHFAVLNNDKDMVKLLLKSGNTIVYVFVMRWRSSR